MLLSMRPERSGWRGSSSEECSFTSVVRAINASEYPVTQLIIDVHAHFVPKCLFERFDAHAARFPGARLLRDDKGVRMQFPGTEPTRPVSPKLSDLADRRAWMDKNGIDHQLVGGWLD